MAKSTPAPTVTVTWNIANLERLCSTGEIQTVHYTVDAVSDDGAYRSGAYGSVGLEPADTEAMVPYADVTKELVIEWLKAKLGDEAIANVEAALEAQLEEQRQPTKAAGLPWGN